MIGGVLTFLRQHLDAHLRTELGETQDDPSSDKIVFVDGDKFEPISFKLGAVSELLINVEEERVLREPDLYARQSADGPPLRSQPDIRLFLYILLYGVKVVVYRDREPQTQPKVKEEPTVRSKLMDQNERIK